MAFGVIKRGDSEGGFRPAVGRKQERATHRGPEPGGAKQLPGTGIWARAEVEQVRDQRVESDLGLRQP